MSRVENIWMKDKFPALSVILYANRLENNVICEIINVYTGNHKVQYSWNIKCKGGLLGMEEGNNTINSI